MVSFDREELLKIARLSALQLNENEIKNFAQQLKTVLDYASQLEDVKHQEIFFDRSHNVNVFREDKAKPTDSKAILDQAPKRKDHYFEFPKVL